MTATTPTPAELVAEYTYVREADRLVTAALEGLSDRVGNDNRAALLAGAQVLATLALVEKLDAIEEALVDKLDAVNENLAAVENRLGEVADKIDAANGDITAAVESVAEKADFIAEKVGEVETRLEALDNIEGRLADVHHTLGSVARSAKVA